MVYSLLLKLAYVQTIPFLFTGIGHPDTDKARKAAQGCLQQYDMPPAQVSAPVTHHRLSRRFLAADSALRLEIEQFAGGAALQSLPHLWPEVCKLKYVPIPERSVERIHAMGKAAISKVLAVLHFRHCRCMHR